MKLKLKNTPEQVELVKAMGSRRPEEAREASEAFAAFIGPVIQQVLLHAGSASNIFVDNEFDEDDNPSYPLDLYYNESVNHVSIWSQNIAGGLPSSHIEGMSEMKISTYRLDSAVSFLKRYARRGRLDVISKAIERMVQEVLVKQERNAWAVIMRALAEARTAGLTHVQHANTALRFLPEDMNAMMVRIKRINASWADGTPSEPYSRGLTDLYVSPEVMREVRGFAYNPVQVTAGGASLSNSTMGLPDNVRQNIWDSAGMSELYGVVLHELLELGLLKKYEKLFASFATAGDFTGPGGVGNYATGTDHLCVGFDLSRDAFIRPVARQHESGGTFTALPDDQYVARAEKTGFYGFLEEGRVCLDARAVGGILTSVA